MASFYSRLSCFIPRYKRFITDITSSRSMAVMARCSSTVSSASTDAKPLPFSAIPGPKGTLFNMFDYARNGGSPKLAQILRKRFERFGPIFREEMFGRRLVNISDVDAMAKVLRVNSSFSMRPGFEALDRLVEEHGHGIGLLSNEYETWYADRSLLSPKLMRPQEANEALPGFNDVARDVVERVRHLRQADGTVINLENELFYWAAESISTFLFDQRFGFYNHPPDPEAVAFVNAVLELTDCLGKLLFGLPLYNYFNTPTYNRLRKSIARIYAIGQDMANSTIAMKRDQHPRAHEKGVAAEERHMSLFDHVYASTDFTPQSIVNILITFLAGGVDTTSTSVLWLVYQLSRHPETQEKLYQELKSVLGTDGGISNKTIGRLPLLKACLKESLRLNPTGMVVPRVFDHDIEVLGYNIPAGVEIMLYTHVVSVDENYYGEDAKEFVPERWLRDETGKKEVYHPFAILPFGYGVRMCLGRRISEAETYALISQLLLSFRLEYAGEGELNQHTALVVKPDKPLLVKLIPR